jgi:hypothetical protein
MSFIRDIEAFLSKNKLNWNLFYHPNHP